MITLTREEAQQVLDALEYNQANWQGKDKAIETLRARLAQPEPEPVAKHKDAPAIIYLQVCDDSDCEAAFCDHHDVSWCQDKINDSDVEYIRADTAPPQREWQGLTDDEIRQLEIMEDEEEERKGWCDPKLLIAWTQALLKEKNR